MNKVFEHAGDLVNIRVAHNLMRLIAEGFGEDDEDADSQLRSSAVCASGFALYPILDYNLSAFSSTKVFCCSISLHLL